MASLNLPPSTIAQVKNKFQMAQSICENDYYRYIDPYLEE